MHLRHEPKCDETSCDWFAAHVDDGATRKPMGVLTAISNRIGAPAHNNLGLEQARADKRPALLSPGVGMRPDTLSQLCCATPTRLIGPAPMPGITGGGGSRNGDRHTLLLDSFGRSHPPLSNHSIVIRVGVRIGENCTSGSVRAEAVERPPPNVD